MNESQITQTIREPLSFSELANPYWINMGHGTSLEIADEILKKGIRVNQNYSLDRIFYWPQLNPSSDLQQELENWPHKHSQAIIIVSVPKTNFNYADTVLGEIEDKKFGKRAFVDPKFIRGYYNTEQHLFVDNPIWQQNPDLLKKRISLVSPPIIGRKKDFPDTARIKLQTLVDSNENCDDDMTW